MTHPLKHLNGNLQPAIIGAIIGSVITVVLAAILSTASWGATDRLATESRLTTLETQSDTAAAERGRILQSIERIEDKIDALGRDIRAAP